MPTFDERVLPLRGNEAVEHAVYARPHLDHKPRYLVGGSGVLDLLPANIVDGTE